eukprot:2983351-Alexandrium_andersonii.AAC.1
MVIGLDTSRFGHPGRDIGEHALAHGPALACVHETLTHVPPHSRWGARLHTQRSAHTGAGGQA